MELRGSCNRCGACCAHHVPHNILDENNVIDGTVYCRYAYKKDGVFHCKLMTEEEKPKDAYEERLLAACRDFPNPINKFFNPKHFKLKKLYPNCGYEVVDGDGKIIS